MEDRPVPSRIQVRRDTGASWTTANPVLAAGEIGYEIDTGKVKLGNGLSTWNDLVYAVGAAFSENEKAKLATVQTGAQVNPADLDGVADSAERLALTPPERLKLAGVQANAQVNAVHSVHGRMGAIVAQPNDYSADQIADAALKVIMTSDERTKLGAIQAGAQVNPTRVTAAEKTAGTGGVVKGFAPTDIKDMVATHAPAATVSSVAGKTGAVSLSKADVALGNVTNDTQIKADFGYSSKAAPAAGDKLVIRDQADGQPKTIDWGQLPGGAAYSIGGLGVETTFDNDADSIAFRDASAGTDCRIKPKSLGFPNVLSDPYQDRLIRIAANNTDVSAALRAAIAAATDGATIKLEGMGVLSRDGSNAWGLQLPSTKSLTIVGTGRGFHFRHANPASDTDAFTMISGDMVGRSLHLENLILEGIWSRQVNKQEVPAARIVNIRRARQLRLYGIQAYDGVDMGLAAQDCGLIRVDRCHIERNTRAPTISASTPPWSTAQSRWTATAGRAEK
jgi:major tropism determinant Mtd-like protein